MDALAVFALLYVCCTCGLLYKFLIVLCVEYTAFSVNFDVGSYVCLTFCDECSVVGFLLYLLLCCFCVGGWRNCFLFL